MTCVRQSEISMEQKSEELGLSLPFLSRGLQTRNTGSAVLFGVPCGSEGLELPVLCIVI